MDFTHSYTFPFLKKNHEDLASEEYHLKLSPELNYFERNDIYLLATCMAPALIKLSGIKEEHAHIQPDIQHQI